jgi:nicotinate-nucleotide pyrophosphorylase (carboxylating)
MSSILDLYTQEHICQKDPGKMRLLDNLLDLALMEDLCSNENLDNFLDVTTDSLISPDSLSRANIILKQKAVVAGLPLIELIIKKLIDKLSLSKIERANLPMATMVQIELKTQDGCQLPGQRESLATLYGPTRLLLKAERTILNLLQRLSGIATLTDKYVSIARPFGIEVLDTRKTMPGMRVLDKYAVRVGGGTNQRFGLSDAILIKDNHLQACESLTQAVRKADSYAGHLPFKLSQANEVEVKSHEQLKEALACGAKRIMLDNFNGPQVKEAVAIARAQDPCVYLEVSGGVNLENLSQYMIRGINGISIGALTHSAPNVDIALDFLD